MNARLATVLIFLFCGTMTVLLVRSVLYPEESRLADVEPRVPFDLFVARSGGSDLDIWDGNRIIGDCRIDPFHNESGPRIKHDKIRLRLGIRLLLGMKIQESNIIELLGEADLHADGVVDDYDLTLSLTNSSPHIKLTIKQPADEKWPLLKLMQGNEVVFESSAGKLLEGTQGLMAGGMLQAMGIPPAALSGRSTEQPGPTTVRAGNIEAGGQSFDGFLFTSGADEETKFRLYMSNTGEILRIKTPVGMEMLAQSLRPQGVKPPKLDRSTQPKRNP